MRPLATALSRARGPVVRGPLFMASSPSGLLRPSSFQHPPLARAFSSVPAADAKPSPGPEPVHEMKGSDTGYSMFEVDAVAQKKVESLASQILSLNVLEVNLLGKLMREKLGLSADYQPAMAMAGGAAPAGAAAGAPAPAAAAPVEEEKVEQFTFDVTLKNYPDAAKVKIIKEVRPLIPGLGLKEAKELVEKKPVMLKQGIPKDEVEVFKSKLEPLGAELEIK
eukprot:NODE_3439_length_928_cov_21.382253_g2865_i0.p1 GENE.NODE_3439_length_928_cov_21.382253_g2865_i0~~NODE_3439_length_928_cov_21.382253_g2865_i0.p1  ORF type:complete len:223 (+),score=48.14 NODE_3439_length_928_cov_21.382253_g2865_i0:196-864(+)